MLVADLHDMLPKRYCYPRGHLQDISAALTPATYSKTILQSHVSMYDRVLIYYVLTQSPRAMPD